MLSHYWSTPHLQTPPIITASIGRWTRISALIQAAQMEWCIILDIRFCKENSWCISLIQKKVAVWCNDAQCRTRGAYQHCMSETQWKMWLGSWQETLTSYDAFHWDWHRVWSVMDYRRLKFYEIHDFQNRRSRFQILVHRNNQQHTSKVTWVSM